MNAIVETKPEVKLTVQMWIQAFMGYWVAFVGPVLTLAVFYVLDNAGYSNFWVGALLVQHSIICFVAGLIYAHKDNPLLQPAR